MTVEKPLLTYYIQGYAQAVGGEPCLLGETKVYDHPDTLAYHASEHKLDLIKAYWFGVWRYWKGFRRVEATTTQPENWPASPEEFHARNAEATTKHGLTFVVPPYATQPDAIAEVVSAAEVPPLPGVAEAVQRALTLATPGQGKPLRWEEHGTEEAGDDAVCWLAAAGLFVVVYRAKDGSIDWDVAFDGGPPIASGAVAGRGQEGIIEAKAAALPAWRAALEEHAQQVLMALTAEVR